MAVVADADVVAASIKHLGSGYSAFLRLKPFDGESIKLAVAERTVATSTAGDNGETIHRSYEFSRVLEQTASQEEVAAKVVLPRLTDCLQGRDSLIISYGATSSGKTYTLQGTRDKPGIIPRLLHSIFLSLEGRLDLDCPLVPLSWNRAGDTKPDRIDRMHREKKTIIDFISEKGKATKTESSDEYTPPIPPAFVVPVELKPNAVTSIWVSYYEVVNEQLFDLIFCKRASNERKRLGLGYDATTDTYSPLGLRQYQVHSWDEAFHLYRCGKRNMRSASWNQAHVKSAGSHGLFTVKLLTRPSARSVNLVVCDLACPERVDLAAPIDRSAVREMQSVNHSLLALSKRLSALREPSARLQPYRESRLTMILKRFLTERASMTMVCNVTLDPRHFQQTQQVLKMFSLAQKTIVHSKRGTGSSQPAKLVLKKRFSTMYGRPDVLPQVSRPVGESSRLTVDVLTNSVERLMLSAKVAEGRAVDQRHDEQIQQLRAELADAELRFQTDLSAERAIQEQMVAVLRENFNVGDKQDPLEVVHQSVDTYVDVKKAATEELNELYLTVEQLENTVRELRSALSAKDDDIATLKGQNLELNENMMAEYSRQSRLACDCLTTSVRNGSTPVIRGKNRAASARSTARRRNQTKWADSDVDATQMTPSRAVEFTDTIRESRRLLLLSLAGAELLGDDFTPQDQQPSQLSPASLMKVLAQSGNK